MLLLYSSYEADSVASLFSLLQYETDYAVMLHLRLVFKFTYGWQTVRTYVFKKRGGA